ncbi:MAG: cytochrome c3 family protein [Myxococcota bacterium]|nr:cytochrome c3 family protein [Myxococcota bacterium]
MSNDKHESDRDDELLTFPSWHNIIPPIFFLVVGPVVTLLAIGGVWYYFSPKFTDVGYMPEQPVHYSHKLHAGELKIDCRYCHTSVEKTPWAGVPPTQTCMNCHNAVKTKSPKLEMVRQSWKTGESIPWVRVHKIADYAYFDHSAHVQVGVGCESCHGRIDQMVEVWQSQPLSMGWCLECHNAPEQHLRPKDKVTVMGYKPSPGDKELIAKEVNPPIHCSGCHR